MAKAKQPSAPPDAHFDSLARSALDFLDQSVRQLESAPKYAVINLATAIELFLKARLVKEHWALVVAKPESATQSSFRDGSFVSAPPEATIARLREIAGVGLTKDEEACFSALRQHRNRLVHFYHPEYVGDTAAKVRAQIAAEQCRAWFLLQRLLRERWQPHFNPFTRQLDAVKRRVAKNQHFLEGKYLALKPDIEAEKRDGEKFEACRSCGKPSMHLQRGGAPVLELHCRVCEQHELLLEVPCPTCNRTIRVEDMGEGTCKRCGFQTSLEWLVEHLGPVEDPKEDSLTAYCGACEYPELKTVVPLGPHRDHLLCLLCLSTYSRLEQCGWCSETIAGADLEDSYVFGCMLCDGRIGHGD